MLEGRGVCVGGQRWTVLIGLRFGRRPRAPAQSPISLAIGGEEGACVLIGRCGGPACEWRAVT